MVGAKHLIMDIVIHQQLISQMLCPYGWMAVNEFITNERMKTK